MPSTYAVYALAVGIAENWFRSGIMPCIRSDQGRDEPVPYIIWCLEGPEGPILVDTAYHPDYVPAQWAQGNKFIEPPELLTQLGLKAHEIRTVVVTHFHVDHFTGFDFFPKATFIVQREEYEFWTGPLMRYDYLNQLIRPKVRPALERMEQNFRIRLVDGDCELYPGVELLKAGGHTPGSQMVGIQTSGGKAVLCGDIAYTYRNLRERLPVGWYFNLPDAVIGLNRALDIADTPELAFPNHDLRIMQGKRLIRVI